jgi:hypothetical protein
MWFLIAVLPRVLSRIIERRWPLVDAPAVTPSPTIPR